MNIAPNPTLVITVPIPEFPVGFPTIAINTPCNTNNEPSKKAMILKTLVRINSNPLKRITI
tara:strand:+ start:349 stop:531 length:183 start_codon:yes stop_codon:yes gene_type:complete